MSHGRGAGDRDPVRVNGRKSWRRTRSVIVLAQLAGGLVPLALSVVLVVLELAVLYVVYRAVAGLIEGIASAGGLVWLAVLGAVAAVGHYALFASATGTSRVAAFRIVFGLRVRVTDRLARLSLGISRAVPAAS